MKTWTWTTGHAGLAAIALLSLACAPPDPVPGPEIVAEGRSPDGLLRRPDLQHLVELQLDRDGPALAAYLDPGRNPDPVVRARAAFALGSVQDTTTAPALLEALHDLDPRVRADAAFAVGQLPMEGLATPLFNALKVEWDPDAQAAQLDALGKRCEAAAARRLFQIEDPALASRVTQAMARCVILHVAEDTLWSRLTADLVSTDPDVRFWAAYGFGRQDSPFRWDALRIPVRRALARYATDEAAAMYLVRALGQSVDRTSWDILRWWMRHGALWQTRVNATAALSRSDAIAPLAQLVEGLNDPSILVRLQAAEGLSRLPPVPEVGEILAVHLATHPEDVGIAAPLLDFLGRVGDRAAVEAWFSRPDIGEERVLLAGIRGAAALPGLPGVALLERAAGAGAPRPARDAMRLLVDRWSTGRTVREWRVPFLELFRRLAETDDPVVRARAAEALEDPVLAAVAEGRPVDDADLEARMPSELEAGSDGAAPDRPYRRVDWSRLARLGTEPRLHLLTGKGLVVLALDAEEAPATVDAVTALAEAGRYDGVPFHRVVPNFVAQGGDVTRGGTESEVDFVLRSEFTRIAYLRGVAGMASAGKDTETTQFFITHSPQPHLDGAYTAFGSVVDGLEVVDRIAPEDRVIRAWVTPGGA